MKMLKRAAAFVLSLVTVLSLSACTKNDLKKYEVMLKEYDGTVNLTIWTYYNNTQNVVFQDAVDAFNSGIGQEKNIHVNHVSHSNVGALASALDDAATSGAEKMPDMFQSYVDDMIALSEKYDNVAKIDKYFTDEELDTIVPTFLNEGRYDGENLMLYPIAKSTEIFMINKTDWDEFAKADSSVSLDDLKTVEGITAAAAKYYEWSGGKALFGRDATANYIFHSAASLGSSLFDVRSQGDVGITFDEKIFRKIYDNYYEPLVRGHFFADTGFRSGDVTNRRILGYVGSSASAGYFPTEVRLSDDGRKDIECYVAPVPHFAGAEKYAIQQGAGVAVTKRNELTEYASCVFLKYLTSEQVNIDINARMGYLPVNKASLASDELDYDKLKNAHVDSIVQQQIAQKTDSDPGYEPTDDEIAVMREQAEQSARIVLDTYKAAVEIFKDYKLYLPQPFYGSNSVRKILEGSLQGSKTVEGMQSLKNATDLLGEINKEAEAGVKTREQLINEKLDGNFEVWFGELRRIVESELAKHATAV